MKTDKLSLFVVAALTVLLGMLIGVPATADPFVEQEFAPVEVTDEDGAGEGYVVVMVNAFINQTTKDDIIDLVVWGFVLILIISVIGYVVTRLRGNGN